MSIEKPKKILYAIFLFSPDATVGIRNKLEQYGPCFNECAIDIVVFNPVKNETNGNVRWIKYEHAESKLFKLRLMFLKYRYLSNFLKTNVYDIVLLRYAFFDFSLPALFFGASKQCIAFEFHSKGLEEIWRYRLPFVLRAALYGSERLLSPFFVRRANAIVAVTGEIASYEADRCGLGSKASCFTFSNGFDVKRVSPYDGKINGDRFVIAFIASLFQPWHGLDRLLKSLLAIRTDVKVTLHLVGNVHNVEELSLIKKLANNAQVEIIQHGMIPPKDVGKILSQAHLAVDSLGMYRLKMSESSTLKAKEYLAMGIPYIGAAKDVDAGDVESFLAVPNDSSIIDIEAVIGWRNHLILPIREDQLSATKERLTWSHKVSRLKKFLVNL